MNRVLSAFRSLAHRVSKSESAPVLTPEPLFGAMLVRTLHVANGSPQLALRFEAHDCGAGAYYLVEQRFHRSFTLMPARRGGLQLDGSAIWVADRKLPLRITPCTAAEARQYLDRLTAEKLGLKTGNGQSVWIRESDHATPMPVHAATGSIRPA